MYLERDFQKKLLFVDPDRKMIYRVNAQTGGREYLSEAECDRRFRKHDCGGWFLSTQDVNSFKIDLICIKCGFKEKLFDNTCHSCPD